jgi:polyhydroxybutyrate depolymerase
MSERVLIIVFLSFSLTFGFSQAKEELNYDGYKRTWLTYLPKNYSNNNKYPLIIALHGGGGGSRQLMNSTKKRFNKLADNEGFIVVYPQGVKKSWNDNPNRDKNGYARKENIDDVGFIRNMIEDLESKYSINNDAIFACGISNGGLMSQTLAMEMPDKIKAIGMVASNFGKNQINETLDVKPFSIMIIHGLDDPVFPYEEGKIGLYKKYRGNVLGVEKSIEYMCVLNGNSSSPKSLSIENDVDDACIPEHLFYENLKNPLLKVELIKIDGGGHTWPGAKNQRLIKKIVGKTTEDFNACDKLWAFFKSTMN